MPPRSKSRTSSVAQELVLALSKPKVSKDDNNKSKKTHKSSISALTNKKELAKSPSIPLVKKENTSPAKINDDWISFLKNKQEDVGPVIKDVRSVGLVKPKSKFPAQKHVKKESISPSKSSSNIKVKDDPDKNNDKVLQSLMTQVSTLESTFGEKISKLESSLKIERSKNKQLESNLEKEIKSSNELKSRISNLQREKDHLDKDLQSKIVNLSAELERDKRKYTEVTENFSKFKKDVDDSKELKEAEMEELKRENDKVHVELKNLESWKKEVKKKITGSANMCRINHLKKLQTLGEENENIKLVLKETKKKVQEVLLDTASLLNKKEDEIKSLQKKLKTFDVSKTKEYKKLSKQLFVSELKVSDFKKALEETKNELEVVKKELNVAKSLHLPKSYSIDEEFENNSEKEEETDMNDLNLASTNKRKRDEEDTNKMKDKKSKKEYVDLEVECLTKCDSEEHEDLEDEEVKKTKEEIRNAILSNLPKEAGDSEVKMVDLDESKDEVFDEIERLVEADIVAAKKKEVDEDDEDVVIVEETEFVKEDGPSYKSSEVIVDELLSVEDNTDEITEFNSSNKESLKQVKIASEELLKDDILEEEFKESDIELIEFQNKKLIEGDAIDHSTDCSDEEILKEENDNSIVFSLDESSSSFRTSSSSAYFIDKNIVLENGTGTPEEWNTTNDIPSARKLSSQDKVYEIVVPEKDIHSGQIKEVAESEKEYEMDTLYDLGEDHSEEDDKEMNGNKDIDVDLLYGDLDTSMITDDTITPTEVLKSARSSLDNKSSLLILHNIDLDESTTSVDSNELVIDLEKSSDDLDDIEEFQGKVAVEPFVSQILESIINSIESEENINEN